MDRPNSLVTRQHVETERPSGVQDNCIARLDRARDCLHGSVGHTDHHYVRADCRSGDVVIAAIAPVELPPDSCKSPGKSPAGTAEADYSETHTFCFIGQSPSKTAPVHSGLAFAVMKFDDKTTIIALDGYRGLHPVYSGPLLGVAPDVDLRHNYFDGHDDTLLRRYRRLVDELEEIGRASRGVRLVALSMGCHLIAKLGEDPAALNGIELRDILLIAPDPKARPVEKDHEETAAGNVSAFEDACALWCDAPAPAAPFRASLAKLTLQAGRTRVVYCRRDQVAQWENNTEFLIADLTEVQRVDLIEAVDGQVVERHELTVDLRPGEGTDPHERLWDATRVFQ